MKITGARIALSANESERRDFIIRQGRIRFETASRPDDPGVDLGGLLLLPGLINAHDHLEFNLFPKLGSGRYPNAKAWADDIYKPRDSPVREHLALSKCARLVWGGLKNVLSGVTTVAHHNPVDHSAFSANFPVKILRQMGWAHSLDFSPDLIERFRATPSEWPFLLHAAEGTDEIAHSEIGRLDQMGMLSERTVLIHAIGLDRPRLELLKTRRTGIVWCPGSNLSVYGRTLTPDVLRSGVSIALGTDSAMTAPADLIGELELASRISGLDSAALYQMVTTRAARLLRLQNGQGELRDNGVADLIAVKDYGQSPAEALRSTIPELVMVNGAFRLVSPGVRERVTRLAPALLHSISLEGRGRWFTDVDVASLHAQTLRALGPDYKLAGKRVSP